MNRVSGKRQCLEVFYVHPVHLVNPVLKIAPVAASYAAVGSGAIVP